MKKYFVLFLAIFGILFSLNAQSQKMQKDLEKRNGIFYLKSDGSKYTGEAFEYYDNGKRAKTTTYKKGKKRQEIILYKSGKTKMVIEYKKGKRHGKFHSYYPSGKIKTEGKYRRGKKKAKWTYYNENGSLKNTERFSLF